MFFGLFCLVYSFRILFIGQTSIYYFFPQISWELVLRLNFITIFGSIPLFIKYFSLLIQNEQKKAIIKIVTISSLLCILIIGVSDTNIFKIISNAVYILLFITFSYCLFLLFKGIVSKHVGAKTIGITLVVLIITVVNDLLYDAQIINSTILTPMGIIGFIVVQSFILSKIFASDYAEKEVFTKELETNQKEILLILGEIIETRSEETGNHVRRVAEYSQLLSLKYGLPEDEAELIKVASTLHDIGKIGIPDSILNKPGKLTKEEFDVIKQHTISGYQMLKHSTGKILKAGAIIALTHHEKYDGSGYPKGLKGEEIPLYGRIIAISDVFDALSTDRVYKKAWDIEKVIDYFKAEKGKHFDPKLVDLFLNNIHEFLAIKEDFSDGKRLN